MFWDYKDVNSQRCDGMISCAERGKTLRMEQVDDLGVILLSRRGDEINASLIYVTTSCRMLAYLSLKSEIKVTWSFPKGEIKSEGKLQ